jgi:hypothetical protein
MGDMELVLAFDDREALESTYREHLRLGRALLHTHAAVEPLGRVTLIVVHPETRAELRVACTVMSARSEGEHTRVALRFVDDAPDAIARIGGFVAELGPCDEDALLEDPPAAADDTDEPHGDAQEDANADALEALASEAAEGTGPSPRIERLRNLNEAQRMQVARGSMLEDRVVLERLYGPSVWPLLLNNPKITVPEVARMARKGTMPRPLLDLIADNDHWIRQSLVRRALLSNPRLSPESTMRVLRATAPRELKLVPQQTAYPMSVRTLAQRLLKGSMPRP